TVPSGPCDAPAAPTFASIDCRLDTLITTVQAANLGKPGRRLLTILGNAKNRKLMAEHQSATAGTRSVLSALKHAETFMRGFAHQLKSLTGKRKIPDAGTRTMLIDSADAIRSDMTTLRSQLKTMIHHRGRAAADR